MIIKLYIYSLCLIILCSCGQVNPAKNIENDLKEVMSELYPESTYEIDLKNHLYHLIISGGEIKNEDILKSKLSIPLLLLYEKFYNSSSSAASSTTFKVSQTINNKTIETETLDLFEMGTVKGNYELILEFIAEKHNNTDTRDYLSNITCQDSTLPNIQKGLDWTLDPNQYILEIFKPIEINACNTMVQSTGYFMRNSDYHLWFLFDDESKILVIRKEL
jgi:hypothetical protein